MGAAGAIVADGRCHTVGNILVNNHDGEHAVFALVDASRGFHDLVAMVAVHQLVDVFFRDVIAYNGHCIAIFPDGEFQQAHFRRGNHVRVVRVGDYFVDRHG